MMQCRDIDELMVEYLYQELDPVRAAEFEAHVQTCARCGAELGSLQRTRQALRALPDAEPPPALSARLLHEASRRAPNPEGSGLFAWLGRLFQPILAHPALAATASVVLLLAVTTLVSVRARVSPHTQEVDLDKAAAPMAATAPAPAATPTLAPEQSFAAAEKAPEGAVGGETGELAKAPPATGSVADKSEHRGRSASYDEQKALKVMKKEAAEVRRDVTDALQQPPVARAVAPKPAETPPAPAKPSPPPAKKALSTRGAAEESPADGFVEGERAANGIVADEKSRAKDSELQSKSSAEVAQAAAPAESKPEPSPPPPPQAPAPSTPQSATGAASAPAAPAANSEANARVASKPDASKNDDNRNVANKGGKARNEAPGASGGGSVAGANAPASNDDTVGSDRPVAAAPPAAPAQNAPEPPEQQMYRQAQKQAAGGQCADALTLTRKIAKINPDFYKRRVAGDPTIQSCSTQQRKSKAPAPAKAQQREADQQLENDKAAK